MAVRRLGIIMHGVTGRMGTNQHLVRSILAIRADGGVLLANGDRVMPDPILVGRNAAKTEALAGAHGVERWTTDLEAALADPQDEIFFDAGTTQMRPLLLARAIAAGKHVYCEKPSATTLAEALQAAALAEKAGVKNGVVMDKLFLPGLLKLAMLRRSGFFGRLLTVRSEFGYWVFEGDLQPSQRPSWNYRSEDGGGIILDMLCHWRYVLDHLFGAVQSVSCLGARHIPERWDEAGRPYKATAEDAVFSTFQLAGDVIATINSSWVTRVYRDDLVVFQVDGTHGSAVAGLTSCKVQPRVATPRPVWNPDQKQTRDFYADWQEMPETQPYPNGFRSQWELFIRHVAEDGPWIYSLREAAKGLQLVEAAMTSWRERRWIDVPDLAADRGLERATPRLAAG
jgi:predicted dehydrogenase